MTLSGNVVVTQGQNVLRGERLVVDLTTGRYTMTSKGRVADADAVLEGCQARRRSASPSASPKLRSAAPKPAPAGPMRIN